MAHVRQSRPDSGLGFQIKVLKTLYVVPLLLEIGTAEGRDGSEDHISAYLARLDYGLGFRRLQHDFFNPLK